MTSRQRRRRARQEKLAAEILPEPTSVNLPMQWWGWFWKQNRINKVMIVGALAAVATVPIGVVSLAPVVGSWLTPKPDIHVGVAFYAHEQGFTLDGNVQASFSEMRNLPSNCSLWRFSGTTAAPSTSVTVSGLRATVLSKYLLKNVSDHGLPNLRMGINSPFLSRTTELSATPNVEAKGEMKSTQNDTNHTYVVSIAAMPPHTAAIISLETPVDDTLRRFLYDEHRALSVVPAVFLSTDQLTFHPTVTRIDAQEMVERESTLGTGMQPSVGGRLDLKALGPSEPRPKDESERLLPKAFACRQGKGGIW